MRVRTLDVPGGMRVSVACPRRKSGLPCPLDAVVGLRRLNQDYANEPPKPPHVVEPEALGDEGLFRDFCGNVLRPRLN